ncbi:hypothetical protein Bca52824_019176 [Brassica carinata]|uniref:Uncharacterized protein n=1 Tax=Brassica carinata TaxID=52824 RepID=A0A8X7VRA4_BRACI|nr:hypothetical protein Bca52824_019176 [Brassica carinata]
MEKDSKFADTVIRGLVKYWPLTNSSEEVMFLGEFEEVLEATHVDELQLCIVSLVVSLTKVAERALFLSNNVHIRNLITQNYKVIMPIVLPAIERNMCGHWKKAVQNLTLNVRKVFCDMDQALFDECLVKFQVEEENETENVIHCRGLRECRLRLIQLEVWNISTSTLVSVYVHRVIKSANILIDQIFGAKVLYQFPHYNSRV